MRFFTFCPFTHENGEFESGKELASKIIEFCRTPRDRIDGFYLFNTKEDAVFFGTHVFRDRRFLDNRFIIEIEIEDLIVRQLEEYNYVPYLKSKSQVKGQEESKRGREKIPYRKVTHQHSLSCAHLKAAYFKDVHIVLSDQSDQLSSQLKERAARRPISDPVAIKSSVNGYRRQYATTT